MFQTAPHIGSVLSFAPHEISSTSPSRLNGRSQVGGKKGDNSNLDVNSKKEWVYICIYIYYNLYNDKYIDNSEIFILEVGVSQLFSTVDFFSIFGNQNPKGKCQPRAPPLAQPPGRHGALKP